MANFLTRLFNEDARKLAKLEKQIQPILALEEEYAQLSDEQLQHKTVEFKERLENGESLDDIYV